MSFKQFQHLVKLEFFGILIGIVTLIVDDMGIGVVFQQDLGDIDVIVIGRLQQRSLPLVVLAVHVGPLVAKVFRHGKVAVISRVDQWCETMAVGLIDVHTLGQVSR